MDIELLYDILKETTAPFHKGGAIDTTEHLGENIVKVDMHFLVVAVDKVKAEARRRDLLNVLNSWPNLTELAGGPSYINVGATIGDQGAAFQLFALGKVLGLWDVITPEQLGFVGVEADHVAGNGYIMCTGYRQGG